MPRGKITFEIRPIDPKRRELMDKKRRALDAFLKHSGSPLKICEEVGVELKEFYKWIQKDTVFRQRIEFLRQVLLDEIEAGLIRRAQHDAKLALKVLERVRPDKWASVELTGKKAVETEVMGLIPREFYELPQETFKELFTKMLEEYTLENQDGQNND